MAKKRVLAVVNVKAKKGELVYYKDGKLIAVEAKRGGTKGAKRKCSTAKPAAKKKTAAKKKAAPKRKAAPKKKAAARKAAPKKKAATKRKTTAKRKAAPKRRQLSLFN